MPRPYECVRRAWHSDRHQPIRGSLVQEIFRLANEVHDPATLKNKEWLEKLPLVVLKAEEIMYCKANSEAEYTDTTTVWERANEAIDTIIRRDDAHETQGDLLQPCIEAALNLGCVPRRASRSQRHNNPGCYLSSVNKPAQHLESSMQLLLPTPIPLHSGSSQSSSSRLESWYSAFVAGNRLDHIGNKVDSVVPKGSFELKDSAPFISSCGFAAPFMDSVLHCQDRGQSVPVGTYNCPKAGRVYPLYYADEQSKANAQDPTGEDGMGFLHNFIGSDDAKGGLNKSLIFGEASENPTDSECDLSLRLGLFSPPSLDAESAWTHEVEDVGSSSSCNGSKCSDASPDGTRVVNLEGSFSSSKDKGFIVIAVDTADEPLESCSSKWSSEEEVNPTRQGF